MDKKNLSVHTCNNNGKRTCLHHCPEVTLIVGLIFIAFGLISFIGNEQIYDHLLRRELGLAPNSKSYDIWHETPVPMYLEFYFFNWTNPEKLGTDKPSFTEMGPYRFRENQDKVDITWNDNDTVSYRRRRFWYYDEENSVGNLSDEVTTLNGVSLTAAFTVRDWNYLLQKSLSLGLTTTRQKIAIRKNVSELLFDGYRDSLLDFARSMPSFKGVEIPFDKFGWFYTRNGSSEMDGYFNMETGTRIISKIGFLKYWNYENRTSFYENQCADIKGSAGEFWPPNQNREPISMYSPDLCRSISFSYAENNTVNGIPGYTYVLDQYLLDNGTLNPDNLCYCNGECSPSGVINVTSCHYGAPAFVSYPHFHLADPYYADSVVGMKPDPEKHQFYITLEPNVGIPLDVGARLQINLLLQPIGNVDLYKNVPKIYFPMFWFNERATMPPDMAESFKLFLRLPEILLFVAICFNVIGVCAVILSLVLFLRKRRRKEDNCYKDNIISVQMNVNDPHSRIPLMGKTETAFDNTICQTNTMIAQC